MDFFGNNDKDNKVTASQLFSSLGILFVTIVAVVAFYVLWFVLIVGGLVLVCFGIFKLFTTLPFLLALLITIATPAVFFVLAFFLGTVLLKKVDK